MKNYEKSETIKSGLRKGFQDGSSKMAQRKCYGYDIARVTPPFKNGTKIKADESSVQSTLDPPAFLFLSRSARTPGLQRYLHVQRCSSISFMAFLNWTANKIAVKVTARMSATGSAI